MSEKDRIARDLNAALDGFRESGVAPEYRTAVGQLRIELTEVNTLACGFTDFSLHVDSLNDATAERMQQIASDLSNRLSYLLEPVQPIEFDQEDCVVQLRSLPPSTTDDTTHFYELIVRKGGLNLRRYEKTAGQERRITAADVTREVLGRLVADFIGAVD